jgi:hypothetical protein
MIRDRCVDLRSNLRWDMAAEFSHGDAGRGKEGQDRVGERPAFLRRACPALRSPPTAAAAAAADADAADGRLFLSFAHALSLS